MRPQTASSILKLLQEPGGLGSQGTGLPRGLWKSKSLWALHSLQWRTLKSSQGALPPSGKPRFPTTPHPRPRPSFLPPLPCQGKSLGGHVTTEGRASFEFWKTLRVSRTDNLCLLLTGCYSLDPVLSGQQAGVAACRFPSDKLEYESGEVPVSGMSKLHCGKVKQPTEGRRNGK